MKTLRWLCAIALAVAVAAPAARAQEPPKPGPEHEDLKKMEGNWDLTMKFGGMESKGTSMYKMELGGLWLISDLESDLVRVEVPRARDWTPTTPAKKKYVGVWVDSMATTPDVHGGHFRQGQEDADA